MFNEMAVRSAWEAKLNTVICSSSLTFALVKFPVLEILFIVLSLEHIYLENICFLESPNNTDLVIVSYSLECREYSVGMVRNMVDHVLTHSAGHFSVPVIHQAWTVDSSREPHEIFWFLKKRWIIHNSVCTVFSLCIILGFRWFYYDYTTTPINKKRVVSLLSTLICHPRMDSFTSLQHWREISGVPSNSKEIPPSMANRLINMLNGSWLAVMGNFWDVDNLWKSLEVFSCPGPLFLVFSLAWRTMLLHLPSHHDTQKQGRPVNHWPLRPGTIKKLFFWNCFCQTFFTVMDKLTQTRHQSIKHLIFFSFLKHMN